MARAVIFDFDGTIADSAEIFFESLMVAIRRKQPLSDAEIKDLRNSSTREIISKLGVKKWQLPRVLVVGQRGITERMDRVEPFEGMSEVLRKLSKSDYKIYILSTNKKANITNFLEKYKLAGYVDEVYAEIGLFGKVKWLRKLIKRQSLEISDCVYVGDETRDVEAAKKVGVDCVAVSWGYSDPKALQSYGAGTVAATPSDLAKIILSAR
jgi:phosphoglycolate phosphatase